MTNNHITPYQYIGHVIKVLGWLDRYEPIDREAYYLLNDRLCMLLDNNPPEELV